MAGTITGVTGTIQDGESIDITGTDFGAKAQAAPRKVDFFEQSGDDYDIGDAIANGWDAMADGGSQIAPKYCADVCRTGSTKFMRCSYSYDNTPTYPNGWGSAFWMNYAPTPLPAVYATFWWRRLNPGGIETDNEKYFRVSEDVDDGVGDRPGVGNTIVGGAALTGVKGGNDDSDWMDAGGWWGVQHSWDVWERMECWFKECDPIGGLNGTIQVWYQFGGTGNIFTTVLDQTGIDTNQPPDERHWTGFILGKYIRLGTVETALASGFLMHHDFDQVYVDTTRARVEIGDNAVWASCTHREIQIPTAWADGAISVTVNQGIFADETAYLFVVDDAGVASDGYEIAVGEVADSTPPFVDQKSPADEATDVSIDAPIVCHIKDVGDGVDTDTIVMAVNAVEVEPVITGTAADYTLTYTPGASLEYSTEYTVSVDGDDLVPNSMTTVEWTFTTAAAPDTTPPTADTFDPADEAIDVSVLTTISCHVKDAGDGVDVDTIVMKLNDVEVATVITGTSEDYTVTHTPAAALEYSTLYTASIDADDLAE